MTQPRFQHYNDFLTHLAMTNPDVSISGLLQQLEHDFQPALLNPELIRSFDIKTLQKYQLLPLAFHEGALHLGAIQANEDFLKALQKAFGRPVYLYPVTAKIYEQFRLLLQSQPTISVKEAAPSVAAVFQRLLEQAQNLRASDIHLEPQFTPAVLVRFRIDGLLHDVETLESNDFDYRTRLISKIKVAADLDIAETRIPQDGRITEQIHSEPVDLRVSTLPSMHGEKVVIRLLPHKNPFQEMRELGLEGEALLTYYNWVKKPQGMILITGQTGSGKTSTLYTTLSQIAHTEKNIVTIEDPIEYKLKGVTQVQVHPKVGLTFANGLRSILRQDPDIILLGEIRDQETAEIAYQSALTGHLVLSTLHTNDAPSAIIRLMDMNVEPYLIASATLGVVAQRLIRKVCPHCAEPYTPGRDLIRTLGLDFQKDYTFYRAKGCDQCFQTGYYGREGIFEVMPVDDDLTGMIQQKEQLPFIRNHLQHQKIQSLYESAIGKLEKGITTIDEINRVVPPTQRAAASGSVFVFMLFLISILSILVLNGFYTFEGTTQALRMERQALQGTYAAHSALQVGRQVLGEHLKAEHLYFLPNEQDKLDNPLLNVPDLSGLFSQPGTITLEAWELGGQYQLSASVAKTEKRQKTSILEYGYQVLAHGILNGRDDRSVAPRQQITGTFQVQTGPLPLSFFERYTGNGTLTLPADTPGQGPWYSPGLPGEPAESLLPRQGYYTQASLPFGDQIAGLHTNQTFQLPSSLWPVIGDAEAEQDLKPARPSVYLTPIESKLGRSYQVLPTVPEREQEEAFQPNTGPWAISVYGNVDRLVLKAGNETQRLELDQIENNAGGSAQGGYRNLTLYKTILDADQARRRVEINTQKWQLTLNPQKLITKQRLESTDRQVVTDRFSGLVLINGSINQLASDGMAYSRPLSIFSSNDIGLSASLRKNSASPAASLGLVTAEGRIAFHPLQAPPVANWIIENRTALDIEAALTAGNFTLQEKIPVTIYGSVAALKSAYPEAVKTRYDPAFYSLGHKPPFYPVLNPDSLALMITRPPGKEHWQEVRTP